MGKLKSFYHEEICAMGTEGQPEPDDLEMLQIDAERAFERYQEALKKHQERQRHEPV